MRTTHTYAILEVSASAYEEIKRKMDRAGYGDQFHDEDEDGIVIDMHGIALAREKSSATELASSAAEK